MNTHQHQDETKPRRRLCLAPIPKPDPHLPEGYSVEEITGVGYRVVVDVDAVAVGAC